MRIGAGSVVGPHCVIEGRTTIGRDNRISQFNSIGGVPQDKKYAGEPTALEIGDRNTIREFCTINVGTAQDAGVTRIGDDNWIMNNVHIAHDCQVGSHTIIAGYAGLAGHVQLGDWAIVGGMSGLLQFVRDRRARDDRLPEPRLAGRAAVHDGRRPSARRCAASTPRACAGAASRPSASLPSSRCTACSIATASLSTTRARSIAALAAGVPEADADVRLVVEFLADRHAGHRALILRSRPA